MLENILIKEKSMLQFHLVLRPLRGEYPQSLYSHCSVDIFHNLAQDLWLPMSHISIQDLVNICS